MGVTFFWVGVGACDIFLGGCGWVRHFSGLVWVGAIFETAHKNIQCQKVIYLFVIFTSL